MFGAAVKAMVWPAVTVDVLEETVDPPTLQRMSVDVTSTTGLFV